MNHSVMHIAFTGDENVAQMLVVVIKSIVRLHHNVQFYLLHKNCYAPSWFEEMNQNLSTFDCNIKSIVINNNFFKEHQSVLPESSYLRLFIPQLIEAERVLYLDCDMLVLQPLDNLYFYDFKGNHMIAVPDILLNQSYKHNIELTYKYLPHIKPYFSSGMMLMNLPLWRMPQFQQLLWKTATDNSNAHFGDQDILNIVLHGKWLPAGMGWNYQLGGIFNFVDNQLFHLLTEVFYCPTEDWKILHYTTPRLKPAAQPRYGLSVYLHVYKVIENARWEELGQLKFDYFLNVVQS